MLAVRNGHASHLKWPFLPDNNAPYQFLSQKVVEYLDRVQLVSVILNSHQFSNLKFYMFSNKNVILHITQYFTTGISCRRVILLTM